MCSSLLFSPYSLHLHLHLSLFCPHFHPFVFSPMRLSSGSFILYLFTCSFWFPVQRQVWLQHGAAHSKQAAGHGGERSGHGLPPRSGTRADGQLHRTGLHNWGHGHLSGKVCQKLTTLGLCSRKLCPGSILCLPRCKFLFLLDSNLGENGKTAV